MLSTYEISKFFSQPELALKLDDKYNKKVIRVTTANDQFFYLKKSTETNPIVLHPKLIEKKEELDKVYGLSVNWKGTHNDNFSGYEKKLNNGKKPSYFGFDVEIEDSSALTKLLKILDPLSSITNSNPLDEIAAESPNLPSDSTTRKTIVDARIGQGAYRTSLISLWGTCAVTNASTLEMLKASHIKPWKDSDNKERLDKFNGLLLSAHLDSAFDNGLISFTDTGEIIISPSFTEAEHFSIDPSMKLKQVFEENKPYLSYHRKNIFQGTP
jgi:hypothetical protein